MNGNRRMEGEAQTYGRSEKQRVMGRQGERSRRRRRQSKLEETVRGGSGQRKRVW
ncbi:hypothetical protein LguiB_017651 [Lonicera macranthoides]